MNILKNRVGHLAAKWLLIITVFLPSCAPERDAEVPYLPFEDIIVNISLPEYFVLQTTGSYKYINGGVKGIILYRKDGNTFYAFERNCTFNPNEACATVEVDVNGLQMTEPCCGSVFNFEGIPVSGPASRELRQYRADFQNGSVIISDDVINGI